MKRAPQSLWILVSLLCLAGLLRANLPQTLIGSWSAASSLSQARSSASAVLLSDGRILIAGGDSGSGPLTSAEFFGSDGTVSSATAMNVARSRHFAVVLNDGHVLAGGGTTTGGGTTNTAEIYDPSSSSWSQINPMTQARAGATAALLQDGRVLIAGGDNGGVPNNSLEIYDPSTGNFSFAGTMSSARTQHAMAVLQDGRVLIVGGFDGTNPLASSDIFDPSSGTVSVGPNLATARYAHSATTLMNGDVVVIGGAGAGTNGTVDLASAEIFDPSTGAFTTASAVLTTAREGHQAFLLPKNNSVLVVGGTSSGTTVAASELFKPQVNSTSGAWTYAMAPTGSNVTPRSATTGSAMQQDGLLLAAGGTDASGNTLASTELCAFPTVKTDQSDYPPGTTVNITGTGFTPGETVTITLAESPLIDTHGPYTVTAQQDGSISDSSFVTDSHDVSVRFFLSAVGSQSGSQAQNTFTDSALKFVTDVFAIPLNTCSPVIQVQETNNASVLLSLTTTSSGGKFYSNSGCSTQITTITTSASTPSNAILYYKDANAGTPTITVTDTLPPHGNSAVQTETISASLTATNLTLAAPGPSSVDFQSTASAAVILTATLKAGATPISKENVNFFVDGFFVGMVNIPASTLTGTATFTYIASSLSIGSHTVQATFEGDNSSTPKYAAITSGTQTLTVNKRTTSSSLSCVPASVNVNSATTCTASVTDNDSGTTVTPTGNVNFTSNESGTFSNSGSCTLSGSGATATCSVSYTPTAFGTGTHTIGGSYGGDSAHTTSSGSFNLSVLNPATTTTVSSSSNPSTYGASPTFTAMVAPASGSTVPTGTVQFKIDNANVGSPVSVSACNPSPNACATFTPTGAQLPAGGSPHSITAVYSGDTTFSGSSATLSQTVNPATLTYTANPASRAYGVTNPAFSGTVTGFVAGDTQASATTGTLSFTSPATASSNVGSYAINGSGLTANNGNYTFVQAASNATALSVTAATLTYTANPTSRAYGVTNPAFSGTVTGFVAGDTQASATTGSLTFTSPATASSNVGSYAINGSGLAANNGNYTFAQAASNATALSITAATLTYTANPASRTYGVTNPAFTGTVTGFVNGDTQASATTGTLSFTSPATASSNVGSYAINGSGLTANNGNYTFMQAAGNATALSVTAATLTYAANPASRAYGVTNPAFSGTVTGFVAGDTKASATTGTLTFTSPATAGSNVGSYAINGSGLTANNGNYTFVQAASNATALSVTAATLTYTANPASRFYGVTNPAFSGTISGFVNGDTQASAITGTLTFTSTATATSNVGSYAINGSGLTANNGNYTFVQAASNATALSITQATPTVTFTGAPVSAYFNSQFMVSAITNATTTATITDSGSCTIAGTTVTMTSGVGTCSLQANWPADINYVSAMAMQSTNALQISVSVSVPTTSVVYDGTPKSVTPTVTPAVAYAVTYTGISPTVYATSSSAPTEPGSYTVAAMVTDPNYTGSGSGTLTITQKDPGLALTLRTGMPEPSPYGTRVYFELTTANSPCPTGQVQFFVDSDNTASSTVLLSNSPCTTQPIEFSTATLQPGMHTVYAVYGGDTYYLTQTSATVSHQVVADGTSVTLATSAMTVFVGDPVTLTATVTLANSIDGTATPPSGTVQFYDGNALLGESALSSSTAMFTVSSLPAGSHSITATYVSANGDFSGSSSPVSVETVNQITPTITWPNPADIVYGTKLSATQLNATATDAHNGSIPVSGTFTYNPAADTVLAVGSFNLMVTFTPNDTATYATQRATATINVKPATLTVTADDTSRAYGADNPTFTFKYSGFVNGETSTVVTTPPTCSSTANSSSSIGTYDITCAGAVAPNYTIIYVNGKLTVNPAALIITASDQTKTYGLTAMLGSTAFTTSGLVNSDSVTSVTLTSAGTAATATVGGSPYAIVPSAGVGTGLGNYTVSYVNGKLTVNPAALIITAKDASKSYGQTVTFAGTEFTPSGLLNSDSVTSVTLTSAGTAATATVGGSPYAIVPSAAVGTGLGNYTISYVNGKLTVNPAALTITAKDASKSYGQTVTFAGTEFTPSGLLNSDSVTSVTLTSAGTAATATVGGSPYAIVPSAAVGTGLGNYTISYISGRLTVNPATLSLNVVGAGGTYNALPYTATCSVASGLVNGDSVTLTITYSSGTAPVNVGTYTATCDSSGNPNYQTATGQSSIIITPATPAVMVTGGTFTYDAMPHAASAVATGVGGVVVPGAFVLTYTPPGGTTVPISAGNYTVSAAFTSSNTNYTGSVGGGAIVINQAQLTVTAADASRPYGQPNPAFTGTLTGGVGGDGITATYASAATTTTAAGVYGPNDAKAIVPTLVDSNNKLSNYNVTSTNGTLTITAIPLLVIANDKTRAFGAADPAFDAQYFGFVNGDTAASSLTGTLTCAPSNGNHTAGSYAIHCGSLSSNNYTLTFVDGTLAVTDPLATIAVNPGSPSVTYSGSTVFAAQGTFASSALRTLANAGGATYPLHDLSTVRTGSAEAEDQGKLYAIGGFVSGAVSDTVEVYDLTSDYWGAVAKLNNARTSARAASVAGKVYVFGGCSDAACTSLVSTPEVYDPNSNSWTAVSSTGFTPRSGMAVGVMGGKIHVAGGNDNTGTPLNVVEIYDPGTGTWSSAPSLKTALGPTSGGVVNGNFYVLGISGGKAEVEAFNGTSWSTVNSGVQSLSDVAGAVLNNVIYVIDGASIRAYDPVANSWTDKTSLNTARLQPQPVTIGNLIYVAGNTVSSATDPYAVESFASDEAKWSSSDTTVSAIDQTGKASALKVGSATITATSIISPSISGSGTLTVNAAKVTPAIAVNGKTYDGTTAATVTSCTVSPVVGNDDVACSVGSANFSDKNAGTGKTVTATSISLTGSSASNYMLSSASASAMTTADIAQRPLVITATGVNKVYDGTAGATVTLSDNRVTGDVFTDGYASATFTDKNLGNGKAVNITGISITGADAGNYTFNASASTTANITPRTLTVTATGANKVYDGTTSATVTLSTDKLMGDYVNVGYTSATFSDKNVGNGKTVTVSGVSITGGADAANYTLNGVTQIATTANITTRTLTVTATGMNKVYDGTTSATVTLSTDKLMGDYVNVAYTTATFSDKNIGNGKTVTVSGVSITGGVDSGNYTLNGVTQIATTANITARTLTVTATGVNKIYDGTTSPTVTLSADKLMGDYVNVGYTSATFSDKNVANGKAVTVSGVSIAGGADAANYTLNGVTQVATTANITPAPASVTPNAAGKVYGATDPALIGTLNGFLAADNVTAAYSRTAGEAVVGSPYTISATLSPMAALGNYSVTYNTANFTITPAPLIITASSALVNYGSAVPAITAGYLGFVNGDTAASLTTAPSCTTSGHGPPSGSPAGNYATNCSGAVDSNYVISYVPGTATIAAVPLTITASSPTANYASAVPAITASYMGFVNGDTVASLTPAPTCTTAAHGSPSASPVDSYATNCSGAVDNNYVIRYVPGTATIQAIPLTITASSPTTNYGSAVPAITPSYSGFVNGDTPASLTTAPACTTVAHGPPSGSPAGSYATNCSGAVDSNYIISYFPGAVTVQAVPLTITAGTGSMIYGGPVFPVTPIYNGFVNGDAAASLTSQPTCSTTATSLSPVSGNPYVSACSGAVDSNYMIGYVAGLVTVMQATTTTNVTSSLSPSTYMQLVTFTATVTPQYPGTTPTGTVTFQDTYNGTTITLGTFTLTALSGGAATLSTSSLQDTYANSITAVYGGDGNFVTSTSPAIQQTVQPAPNVSLSPMSVSFGNINLNATSKMAVILTNIGDATLNISTNGISITGTDYTEFAQTNNCGSTVLAGKSCTINISFTPTYTGVASAGLQITDNDDDSTNAQQLVSLTGAGLSTISGGSLFTDALFATANGCGSILASGGSTVDSFSSVQGFSSSHVLSGGNVGTNGNVTLNGSKSMIYGTAAVDSMLTGSCGKGSVTGITTSGGAQVTGGAVALNGPITYPAPPAPSPAAPTTTQNISGSCGSISGCTNTGTKMVSLAPGQYGNLSISGGTTAHVSTGTYNINSLTLTGNSILYVDSGPVVVNLAGASLSGSNPAMDASGGSIQNPTGKPSNLQFTYAGSRGVTLSGGSWSYATVYAPNALVNMSGGSDFFGSIIGSTVTASGGTAMHFDTSMADIHQGNTIWFTALVNNVNNLGSGQVKLYLTNSSVTFTGGGTVYNLPVPNAVVTFNSVAVKSPTTIYDSTNNRWSTSIAAKQLTGNTFVAGVAFQVPTDFPTGIQNATWSASFSTDTPNVNLQWQWSASVYTSFGTCTSVANTNCNTLGVNAEDGSANTNGTDPAGTPESYKGSVTFGAMGGGLTNYTGYRSSAAAVVPTIAPMSVSPSSLDFATQSQGATTATALTAVLANNDSVQHNFTGSGITMQGTNAGDFTLVPNGPGTPNNCLALSGLAGGASCTLYATFTPSDVGTRTAKIVLNDDANNSPQTVYLSGTGQ